MVPSESLLLDNFNGEQVLDLDVPKNITNPVEKSERAHVKIYGNMHFFKIFINIIISVVVGKLINFANKYNLMSQVILWVPLLNVSANV